MVGRAIAQLLPPGFAIAAGSLLFEGVDLVQMPPSRRRALLGRAIGFIPQQPMTALNPVMTIGAQFDEHLARLGEGGRAERRERAIAALADAHLHDAGGLLGRYPHQLSGGMLQRVLIALAFSSNPRLVIADEPTTALDVTIHPPILRLIAEMQRQHATAVIFITHDLRLAAQLCDQVVVMYAGRAIESGPARSILSRPAHPYTRCLQLANPSMHDEQRALYVIPDQMPSLRQLQKIPGCHFAPRCPLVEENCRRADPPDIAIGADHRVACIRAAEAVDIASPSEGSAPPEISARIVLQVEKLQKRYRIGDALFGGTRTVDALKDASFNIAENEFVALVGESGSGKSTVAKLLVGLEPPSGGRILLNGDDLADPSSRGRVRRAASVQMVFQDPQSALNPRRRVASIITQAMEAGSRHATWDERLARTKELLAEVGSVYRFRNAPSWPIVRRTASAREHCARALQYSQGTYRRRDRVRTRRFNPGAAVKSPGPTALRARLRHALYFSRPVGRPPLVLPRAGDVSRRNRRTGPDRNCVLRPAASAHARACLIGAAR